jgi:hypothetical protein
MSWRDIDAIMDLIGGMDSAEPPVKPVIVKHQMKSLSDLSPMFGFWGFSQYKSTSTLGVVNYLGKIDQNKQLHFYADGNGVQWGVLPYCEHNANVLTDCAKSLPLTIADGPSELIEKFNEMKAQPDPVKPKGKKLTAKNNDPFFGVKLTTAMPVEGEANHDGGQAPEAEEPAEEE